MSLTAPGCVMNCRFPHTGSTSLFAPDSDHVAAFIDVIEEPADSGVGRDRPRNHRVAATICCRCCVATKRSPRAQLQEAHNRLTGRFEYAGRRPYGQTRVSSEVGGVERQDMIEGVSLHGRDKSGIVCVLSRNPVRPHQLSPPFVHSSLVAQEGEQFQIVRQIAFRLVRRQP